MLPLVQMVPYGTIGTSAIGTNLTVGNSDAVFTEGTNGTIGTLAICDSNGAKCTPSAIWFHKIL